MEEALAALGNIGDCRATKPILGLLQEEVREEVQVAAVKALGDIHDATAIRPLAAALKGNMEVAGAAAAALVKFGKESVDCLTPVLRGKDTYARLLAAEALGRIADKRAVGPLTKVLSDEYAENRYHAAEALGRICDKSAVQPLVERLKDDDENVRKAAAKALVRLKWQVRTQDERVALAVANGNYEAAARAGAASLDVLAARLKDEKRHVSNCAAKAMGSIGDPRAFKPLLSTLRDRASRYESARPLVAALEELLKRAATGVPTKDLQDVLSVAETAEYKEGDSAKSHAMDMDVYVTRKYRLGGSRLRKLVRNELERRGLRGC
jgi:HEAT repeat protein